MWCSHQDTLHGCALGAACNFRHAEDEAHWQRKDYYDKGPPERYPGKYKSEEAEDEYEIKDSRSDAGTDDSYMSSGTEADRHSELRNIKKQPRDLPYKTQKCRYWYGKDHCMRSIQCRYAHGEYELEYWTKVYNKENVDDMVEPFHRPRNNARCDFYVNEGYCSKGLNCLYICP